MSETTIEWFDLSSEYLALVMQSCGDQLFIGFEKICAATHGRQAFQLLEKLSRRPDWSTTTNKAKNFANSRIYSYPDPAFRFFLATKLQSSSTSIKEQACVLGWLTGNCQAAWTSHERLFCDAPREFCQWLWAIILRGIAFEPVLWGPDPCLWAVSERFVDKLGSGNVEFLDSYQSGCRLDDHSEDIASLVLQVSEITSFV